jgi:hypothetical protein
VNFLVAEALRQRAFAAVRICAAACTTTVLSALPCGARTSFGGAGTATPSFGSDSLSGGSGRRPGAKRTSRFSGAVNGEKRVQALGSSGAETLSATGRVAGMAWDAIWPDLSPAIYRVHAANSDIDDVYIHAHVTIEAWAVFEMLGR